MADTTMIAHPDTEPFTLLRIIHRTLYRYSGPVSFQPHRLVLRPREGHDLRVERLALHISPRCDLIWSRDIFGNSVAHAYFNEPAAELRFENDLLVQRFKPLTPANVVPIDPYPVQYESLERSLVIAYLSPVYPEDMPAVQEWVRSQSLPTTGSADDLMLELTARIYRSFQYQRREEKGVQSPATTLTLGTGSCRDFATFLMEAARHLGLAARFASGYLDCAATRAARGSTHAWTEIYFPSLGWRGFDPTTGKRCTHQHILIGVSNHPRGVMPVSGKFIGNGNRALDLEVVVEFAEVPATPSSRVV
jgi:transglutaminase-like putative cysteine protease